MLKKTETEETIMGFIVTFLSQVKFQLGGMGEARLMAKPMLQLRKTKKVFANFRDVSGVFQQNLNGSKNSAVLEPRTGQFSRI